MKNQPLPDSELLVYSEKHVAYEVDMFFGMAEILSRQGRIGAPSEQEALRVRNAIVESFGLHLRNLIEFLFYDEYKNDVLAIRFSNSWRNTRGKMSTTLKAALNRANKQLAHLTADRMNQEGWEVKPLSDEMRTLLRSFVKDARPGALSPRVAAAIR